MPKLSFLSARAFDPGTGGAGRPVRRLRRFRHAGGALLEPRRGHTLARARPGGPAAAGRDGPARRGRSGLAARLRRDLGPDGDPRPISLERRRPEAEPGRKRRGFGGPTPIPTPRPGARCSPATSANRWTSRISRRPRPRKSPLSPRPSGRCPPSWFPRRRTPSPSTRPSRSRARAICLGASLKPPGLPGRDRARAGSRAAPDFGARRAIAGGRGGIGSVAGAAGQPDRIRAVAQAPGPPRRRGSAAGRGSAGRSGQCRPSPAQRDQRPSENRLQRRLKSLFCLPFFPSRQVIPPDLKPL